MTNRFRVLVGHDLFALRHFVHVSLPNELTYMLVTLTKRYHFIAITGQGRARDDQTQKQPRCLPVLVCQGRSTEGPHEESCKPESCVPLRLAPRADDDNDEYGSK